MDTYKILFGKADSALFSIEEIRSQKNNNIDALQIKVDRLSLPDSPITYTFLNQTHSNLGFVVHQKTPSFAREGDYLLTNKHHQALSILTADCLPLILYDQERHACAIIHAGWKGSVQKIAQKAFYAMQTTFNTQAVNTLVFLGPHAKSCCYEVSDDFAHDFYDATLEQSLIKKNDLLYFDNARYTTLELVALGIPEKNINYSFSDCTMCTVGYGSFRKFGGQSPLNISYVYLL